MTKANGIPSVELYIGSLSETKWTSNDSSVSPRQLYNLATRRFPEMVKKLKIRLFFPRDSDGEFIIVPNVSDPSLVSVQRHRRFGRCWSLNLDYNNFRKYGISYIKAWT